MANNNQDNPLESAILNLIGFVSSKDDSAELLISNLVSYLVNKGIIDLDEYLEHTQVNKEKIVGKMNCK